MSSDCCASGHLHSHPAPTGEDVTIAGLPAYLVTPHTTTDDPKKVLIIATDVFGYKLPNTRLIADKYAAAGFLVVVPDLLDGEALSPAALTGGITPDIQQWFVRHSDAEHVMNMLEKVVHALHTEHGAAKVAIQGYCWGGRFAVLAAGSSMVQAFAAAHPSFVSVPTDIQAIQQHGIFILAETDARFTPDDVAKTKEVAATLPVTIEFKEYPGTTHGFAVRGSDTDEIVREAREDAVATVSAFLHRVLV